MRRRLPAWGCAVVASVLLAAGCKPAVRYDARTPGGLPGPAPTQDQPAPSTGQNKLPVPPPSPIDPGLGWLPADPPPPADVPVELVSADRDENAGAQLLEFWNEPSGPGKPVRIKVPLGLDDPAGRVPAADPLGVRKWALGKKLFFNATWLTDGPLVSCASCHLPARGYARDPGLRDGPLDGLDTPLLVNAVYGTAQFWDGRVADLEEVVQRSLEDNRDPPLTPPGRHVWPGVVKRLRDDAFMVEQFHKVFGTPPTQDAVGKALATYVRTLFSGNSVHDRAVREAKGRGASAPEKADYAKALTDADLKALDEKADRDAVAARLQSGFQLFTGKAGCASCHGGPHFTDHKFHNVRPAGKAPGRFAALPPGLKDPAMIGAFKTPTLRGLPFSAPYLHDGSAATIEDAVRAHASPQPLGEDEVAALALFLRGLAGDAPNVILTDKTKFPASAAAP